MIKSTLRNQSFRRVVGYEPMPIPKDFAGVDLRDRCKKWLEQRGIPSSWKRSFPKKET